LTLNKAGTRPVPNVWHVEFNKDVKLKDFNEEVDRIISTYGGEVKFRRPAHSPLRMGFFIVTDEGRARAIAEDPRVRRVEQDYSGTEFKFGSVQELNPVPKPKDQQK
jgi:hypothetical protein